MLYVGFKRWHFSIQVIVFLGSSNGRTAAFGAVSGGSNPPLRAINAKNE